MHLRVKLMLVIATMFAAILGVAHVVNQRVLVPEFARIEKDEAVADMQRCIYAIQRDVEYLSSIATDYGSWDDTYGFVETGSQEYIDENLVPETFQNLKVNLLLFVRTDGTIVWGKVHTGKGAFSEQTPEQISLASLLASPGTRITKHDSATSAVSGILLTPLGPMLLGSAAITTSNREGFVRGAVMMGRLLDTATIEEWSIRAKVPLRAFPLDRVPGEDRVALQHLTSPDSLWTNDADNHVLRTYRTIQDLFGRPALLVRSDLLRTISQRAVAATSTSLAVNLGGGLTLAWAVWCALSHIVIRPLSRLTRHAVQLGAHADLRTRIGRVSGDEIGTLAVEFDRMVDHLGEAQSKLVELAHSAGKSQVAADVLHNVGNVLNSLTVSTTVAEEKIRNSEAPSVRQAAQLLISHRDVLGSFMMKDERGRAIPDFLDTLGTQLMTEQAAVLDELSSLSRAIQHIRAVIQSQQAHRSDNRLLESVSPAVLVNEAIQLTADGLNRHCIRIERRFGTCPEFMLDQHRVLQILVNLITNAKQAIKAAGKSAGVITIGLRQIVHGKVPGVEITVTDDGIGIAQEQTDHIFAAGYSTREAGQGLGLHSAANMARECDGQLSVASAGPGQGATFTLSLPAARTESVP